MSISDIALANSNFTNRAKGSSRSSNANSTYIGIVTRIVGDRVILRIPKLNPVTEFGPCDIYCDLPNVGQNVLCGYIDERFEHLVVLAKKYTTETNANDIIETQVFS
jgi:hypothetical protein